MRKQSIFIWTAAILLVLAAGYVLLVILLFAPPKETTDIGKYSEALKGWWTPELVAHFPPAIPEDASTVRFVSYPGFLQGGAYVQLRLKLPADRIAAIEAQLKQSTTHAYAGGDMFVHYNKDQENNWPTTNFRTGDAPNSPAFPDHYTLYVLSAEDKAGGSWNHGNTRGAAVSTLVNEVIYWMEVW